MTRKAMSAFWAATSSVSTIGNSIGTLPVAETLSVGAQAALDRAVAVLEGLSGTVVSGFAITCSKRAERMAYVENDGPVFWQHRGVSWLIVSSPTS